MSASRFHQQKEWRSTRTYCLSKVLHVIKSQSNYRSLQRRPYCGVNALFFILLSLVIYLYELYEKWNPFKRVKICLCSFKMFRDVKNYKVLACGGDGTVAWVLHVLDNLQLENPPPVRSPLSPSPSLFHIFSLAFFVFLFFVSLIPLFPSLPPSLSFSLVRRSL
jgi:hypothetical protein